MALATAYATAYNATHANQIGWSDTTPYEIVKVISAKTIEIREMVATLDPTWTPEFIAGGFVGHCINQSDQRWTYEQNPEAPVLRARLRKDGRFHSVMGRHLLSDKPQKFYDYNF